MDEEKGFEDGIGMKWRCEEQWKPKSDRVAVEDKGDEGWLEMKLKSSFKMGQADLSKVLTPTDSINRIG